MVTPFFPALRRRFAACKSPSSSQHPTDSSRLEALLGHYFPSHLLSQNDEKEHSRSRSFPLRLTFWTFLWQTLSVKASCQAAVKAAFQESRDPFKQLPSEAAYVKARQHLPLDNLRRIEKHLIDYIAKHVPTSSLAKKFRLRVVDGSSCSLPDTEANQKEWPQSSSQKPGCGFPLIHWVGLFCLASGALLNMVTGNHLCQDITLFQQLWGLLHPGDLLVADRGFSSHAMFALLQKRGVEAVIRLRGIYPNESRFTGFKKIQHLGEGDHLVEWQRPRKCPTWMPPQQWEAMPRQIKVRLILFKIPVRGFREQEFVLATTLLDAQSYPREEIILLYKLRWRVEGFIGQMKTHMGAAELRCKAPESVERELAMHRIAYNLIRCVQMESAICCDVILEEMSFMGALTSLRTYMSGDRKARSKKQLLRELMEMVASKKVIKRPGRSEPRAKKRRPKPFALLNKPRGQFVDIPHRSRYKKQSA